jgi:phage terminase small subunit
MAMTKLFMKYRHLSERRAVPQLNSRQLKFCREYAKNGNATQSAIRAGYGERGAAQFGYQLLQDERIKLELERLKTAPQTDNTLVQVSSGKFSVEEAMVRAQDAYDTAADKRDSAGMKGATELMSKLMGLLKEKNQDEVPITINIDVGKPCPKCGHIDERAIGQTKPGP